MTDPLLDTAPMRPVRPGRRPSGGRGSGGRTGRRPSGPPSRGLTIGAALGLWITSFLTGSAIGALTRDDDRAETIDPPQPAAAEVAPPGEPDTASSDEPAGGTGQPAGRADGPAVPVATSTPTAAQPQPPPRGRGHGHQPEAPAGDDRSDPGPGSEHGGEESTPPPDPPGTTTTTAPPTTAPPTTATTTTTTTAPAGPSGPANGDTVSIAPLPG